MQNYDVWEPYNRKRGRQQNNVRQADKERRTLALLTMIGRGIRCGANLRPDAVYAKQQELRAQDEENRQRGETSERHVHELLDTVPEVYEISRSKQGDVHDMHGRDLRVYFYPKCARTGNLSSVGVQVKSSETGVDKFEQGSSRRGLLYQRIVVLNASLPDEQILSDFWDQVRTIATFRS